MKSHDWCLCKCVYLCSCVSVCELPLVGLGSVRFQACGGTQSVHKIEIYFEKTFGAGEICGLWIIAFPINTHESNYFCELCLPTEQPTIRCD